MHTCLDDFNSDTAYDLTHYYHADEVDIWLVDMDPMSTPCIQESLSILAPSERDRYSRFKCPLAQKEYFVGKLATRYLFTHYHPHISPGSWRFSPNAYGKLFQTWPRLLRPLHFNLSHSKGLVSIGISRSCELGIDVEFINRETPSKELAAQCFSEEELATFLALDDTSRIKYFFTLWTLKEAYIKAEGRGVSLDLKSFSFSFDHNDMDNISFTPQRPPDKEFERWHFKTFKPTSTHQMALAYR